MKCFFTIILSLLCYQTNAQNLSFKDLEKSLILPPVEAEDILALKGYTFYKKESGNDKITYFFKNNSNTASTTKVLTKVLWNGQSPTSYYVRYLTFDLAEFQRIRKFVIENQFKRLDKDINSKESNYNNGTLDVRFAISKKESVTAYFIYIYDAFERLMIESEKRLAEYLENKSNE